MRLVLTLSDSLWGLATCENRAGQHGGNEGNLGELMWQSPKPNILQDASLRQFQQPFITKRFLFLVEKLSCPPP
jgi:hypothetical protein